MAEGGPGRGFIPPPLALQRVPPSYNEVTQTHQLANVDGYSYQSQSTSAAATLPLQTPDPVKEVEAHQGASTSNPFDDFVIEGYEQVTYEQTLIKPPPPLVPSGNNDLSARRDVANVTNIDDATARDAVLSQVSQHLCWGLAAAKEMLIMDIIPSSAFHYNLETCTEKRTATWVHEPFTGQPIDTAERGPSPKPWDVLVVPPSPFKEGQVVVEVPHSARVVNCHECGTLGRRRCWSCFGNGEIRCSACNGTGQPSRDATGDEGPRQTTPLDRVCYQCNGAGRRRCVVCLGPGQLPCKTCLARGQLKLSLQLTVTWKIHRADRVVERTAVPESLIRAVPGRVAFEEERAVIWPINFFPDEAVNHASRELLEEHRTRFTNEKTMIQKQSVRMVPVYQVAYSWRNARGYFYIYGHDNFVHFPDYPQKVCCGLPDLLPCSIL